MHNAKQRKNKSPQLPEGQFIPPTNYASVHNFIKATVATTAVGLAVSSSVCAGTYNLFI